MLSYYRDSCCLANSSSESVHLIFFIPFMLAGRPKELQGSRPATLRLHSLTALPLFLLHVLNNSSKCVFQICSELQCNFFVVLRRTTTKKDSKQVQEDTKKFSTKWEHEFLALLGCHFFRHIMHICKVHSKRNSSSWPYAQNMSELRFTTKEGKSENLLHLKFHGTLSQQKSRLTLLSEMNLPVWKTSKKRQ